MNALLVGCGNMGRALLDGWLAGGALRAEQVTVADPLADAPPGVALVRAIPQDRAFDLVVLAIKPQQFADTAPSLASASKNALVLSILAGLGVEQLAAAFPGARVARIMANLAAAFGQSPVALFAGPSATAADRTLLDRLGGSLGPVTWLDDEALMHAVTALGGSGPGFVYRLLEAFARGGAALGRDGPAADAMTLAMFRGALELAARSGAEFATLAARVASPGGTTRAGLDVLESDVDRLVAATLLAARDRSAELAEGG